MRGDTARNFLNPHFSWTFHADPTIKIIDTARSHDNEGDIVI